ncbi:hypothetical protein HDU77_001282, partial [Chytriomyces hyalinus]
EAERVLMRVLLRYLHNFWREEHPDSATDFTTWFYPDCRRNEGMRHDMILGTEQIAVSTHHAYDFTASDHVPVIAVVCLCNLRTDFSHLLYGDDLQFDDGKSDLVSELGFHECSRCGMDDLPPGSDECSRCTEGISDGSDYFGSEGESLELESLGPLSPELGELLLNGVGEGFFEDGVGFSSESDFLFELGDGWFTGFDTVTDTESSSSDSGEDDEESSGGTTEGTEGDSLVHQFVPAASFCQEGNKLKS